MEYAEVLRYLTGVIEHDLGVALPEVRINPGDFETGILEIRLNDVRLPKVRGLGPAEVLLFSSEADLDKLGVEYFRLLNPIGGCYYLCTDDTPETGRKLALGDVVFSTDRPPDYLKNFLEDVLRANAGSLLASPIVYLLFDKQNLRDLTSNLQSKFGGPSAFYRKTTAAMRWLLDEQVSIRDLEWILESLFSLIEERDDGHSPRILHYSQAAGSPLAVGQAKSLQDLCVADLAFAARLGVRSLAVKYFSEESGKQIVGIWRALPKTQNDLLTRVAIGVTWASLRTGSFLNCELAIIAQQSLRASLKSLLRVEFPSVAVLGENEITSELIGLLPDGNEKDLRPLDLRPDKLSDRRSLARRFETAILRLHEALPEFSGDIDVQVAAAFSDIRAGRTDDGVKRLERTETLAVEKADWQRTLGQGYYAAGRDLATNRVYSTAREMLGKAVSLDPKVPVYHYELAQTYDELGQLAEAGGEYQLAASNSTHDACWQAEIGAVFYSRQAYEEAIGPYRRAAFLAVQNADYYRGLGHSLFGVGAYRKAIDAYRQAARLTPEIAAPHAWLADALTRQGDYLDGSGAKNELYNEAVVEYRLAIKIADQIPWYHHHLSWPLTKLRDLDGARQALRQALDLDQNDLVLRRELAGLLSEQKNYQEALKELLALPPGSNESIDYLMDLANAYAALGRYADAVNVANRIEAAKTSENPKYEYWVGALGQLASSPEDPERHQMLAQSYDNLHNYTMAAAEYRKAVALKPDHQRLHKLHKSLGNALFKGNDLVGAAQEWGEVLVEDPEDALTINNLGTVYDGLGRPDEAIAQYELSGKLQPGEFVPYYNIGAANYRLARMQEARNAYEQAKNLKQGFAPIYYNLGNCYYRLGDSEAAKKEWEAAINLNPNFPEASFNLGVVLWDSGNREGARRRWQDALKSDRNFAAAEDNLEAEKSDTVPDLEIRDLNRGR
jgi:tetratricopeptide (TPR) repeat protein